MAHTIFMLQLTTPDTRTYSDYDTLTQAVEAVVKLFEDDFKRKSGSDIVTYDVNQMFDFLDTVADISFLVFKKETNMYSPMDKDAIKEKIYALLRQTAMS